MAAQVQIKKQTKRVPAAELDLRTPAGRQLPY